MDIVITLPGIGSLFVSVVLLNWLVSFALKTIAATWFRQHSQKVASVRHTTTDESVRFFFTTLKKILSNGTWLLPVIFYSEFLQVPYVVTKYLTVALNDYCEANSSGSIPILQIALRLEVWGYTNKACLRRLVLSPRRRTSFL